MKKRGRPIDEKRTRAILSAASELFMERGFTAVSMDEIAARAKVSKITLYSRFPNKHELFSTVIQAKCCQYIPGQLFDNFDTLPAREALTALGVGLMSLITSPDGLRMYRMMGAMATVDPQLPKMFYENGPQRMKGMVVEKLKLLHERGLLHITDPKAAKEFWGALFSGSDLYMQTFLGLRPSPSRQEILAHVRHCVEIFMTVYAARR